MFRKFLKYSAVAAVALIAFPFLSGCSGSKTATVSQPSASIPGPGGPGGPGGGPGGPQLGKPGGGPGIDKSGDSTLQAMIKYVAPKFKQYDTVDEESGLKLSYNLYTPENMEAGKKYPMVVFTADASTAGREITLPLTQGYGALVWATDEWQAQHPCYVLVPQYNAGVAVNDAYEHSAEVDAVARLVSKVAADNAVDTDRLYTTGQSMGGMISMYWNVAYPDMFAASIFVDCHWATSTFPELARHKFIYFVAGDSGKAYTCVNPLEEACRADGVQYTFAEWSAKLPESRQSELAATMLEKGAPVNIFMFEPKSVLPASGQGSEHMYSFDYAYKVTAAREWLFRQSK